MAARDDGEASVFGLERIEVDSRPHAEEPIGGIGIVMPVRSAGVDDPLAERQNEIVAQQLREGVDYTRIVKQGVEGLGIVVEEGNDLLSLLAGLRSGRPAARFFHRAIESPGKIRYFSCGQELFAEREAKGLKEVDLFRSHRCRSFLASNTLESRF